MIRLTRAQVREIDKRAIEKYHIPGIVLMENASRAVADHIHQMYGIPQRTVLVLCGGGNNGGDGLAVARHLHNRAWRVQIVLAVNPINYKGDALLNWKIVEAMSLPVVTLEAARKQVEALNVDLFVDALFGTGLTQTPRAPFDQFVALVESAPTPVVSIDLPSGMDCDTGNPLGPCIRATHTITFVAEKTGFANPTSRRYTGEIIVADIGCPRELIEEVARESLDG